MMTRRILLTTAVAALAMTSLGVAGVVNASKNAASDAACPGKIVCPITGELVCRDKCPRVDQNRPDCPGRIVCPEIGELVCADRCPLGDDEASAAPSCCTKKADL